MKDLVIIKDAVDDTIKLLKKLDDLPGNLRKIENKFQDIENELGRHSGVSKLGYSFHDRELDVLEERLELLSYLKKLPGEIDDEVDNPFYKSYENLVDELGQVKSEDFSTPNIIGCASTPDVKNRIKFEDILLYGDIDEKMHQQYENMKLAYIEQEEEFDKSYEEYIKAFIESGEFDYERQWEKNLSIILDIIPIVGTIKNGIELFTGKDLISGREMEVWEQAVNVGGIILDCIPGIGTIGSIVVDVGKSGAKAVIKGLGKYLIKETIQNAVSFLGGQLGAWVADKVGLPPWLGSIIGSLGGGFASGKLLYGGKPTVEGLSDGSTKLTMPDGSTKIIRSNGDLEITKPNGDVEITRPDGTIETTKPNGDTEVTKPDGTVKIPSVKNGAFNKWFDDLSPEDFSRMWEDPKIRRIIEDRIRHPGGYHEWHLVSRTPKFKEWDVSMGEIKDMRTLTKDVEFVNPPGVHGGTGSTTAHNEILRIIDTSPDYETFVKRLNNWAKDRLKNGILDLPERLRR